MSNYPPPTIEEIQMMLICLDPNCDRDEWSRVLMAVKSEYSGADGLDAILNWSSEGNNYREQDVRDTWRSIKSGGGVNIGTLIYKATAKGFRWSKRPEPLSPEEKARREQAAKVKADAEEKALSEKRESARITALELWNKGNVATNENPYLLRKGVLATTTLKQLPVNEVINIIEYEPKSKGQLLTGELLIVPIVFEGNIVSIEMIDGSGLKHGLAGGQKKGGCWATKRIPENKDTTFLVCEGVSTTISAATSLDGSVGISTFSCGNLLSVSKSLRAQYPQSKIILVSDLGNGEKHAIDAANECGGYLARADVLAEAAA